MFTIRIKDYGRGTDPQSACDALPAEHMYEAIDYSLLETNEGGLELYFHTPGSGPITQRLCFCDEVIIENSTGKTVDILRTSRRVPGEPVDGSSNNNEVSIWRRGEGSRIFSLPAPQTLPA